MKPRILIIDDEESIRFTFENFLSEEGYEVLTARDYDEAVEKIEKTDFNLIFADIILGGKTGIDVLREVRKKDLNCPVIILTGYPNIETAAEAVRLGAFDYLPKPIMKKDILHITEMALQHKMLKDKNEEYRTNLEAIFRSVKDALITVNKELIIVEVNEAAKEACGFDRNDIGKPLSPLGFESQRHECGRKCLDAINETIEKKQPVELFRIECHRKERAGQVVNLTASPLLDSQGKFLGAVLAVKDETRLVNLERDLKGRERFRNIIGRSEKMQKIYELIETLSDVQTTVLIRGESGTGKELVAEALHYIGDKSEKTLVKVNCSALTETLLESELFGHVKGAFTGALQDRAGRFKKADGGTIFLDEIADISPIVQKKLLRVLQEGEFESVGSSTPVKVNVRVIAATNQDLAEKVKKGEFREDLYYRLKVMEVIIPPLRERREDIPLLTKHFIEKFNKKLNKEIKAVSDDVGKIFMQYAWPGNIREMEHAIEHAFILCRQNTITAEHLPPEFKDVKENKESHEQKPEEEIGALKRALEKTAWNKAKAARLLGISRRTVYRKILEHKITKPEI